MDGVDVSDARERSTTIRDKQIDRRVSVALFAVVACVYLATGHMTLVQNQDTRAAAMGAWSLGTQGTVALPEAWPEDSVAWPAEGTDGRTYVNRFPGVILWGAPFYGVHGLVTGDGEASHHPHLIDYRPAAVAGALATAAGITLGFFLFRRLTDRRTALTAAIVMAFATSAWSISGTALWTHSVTHLALTAGMLALASERFASGGLAFGWAVLSRPQTAIIPAVVGLWEGVASRKLRPIVMIGITSALGLLGIVLYSWQFFGTWLPISGYGSYAANNLVGMPATEQGRRLLPVLFDPMRGLLARVSGLSGSALAG